MRRFRIGAIVPNEAVASCQYFGTGTAAVISPVGKLRYVDDVMLINNGEIGPLSQKLYDTMTGIQYGKLEDKFGWRVQL